MEAVEAPVHVVAKDEIHLVGIEVRAAWQDLWTEMPKAWQSFLARAGEIDDAVGGGLLDVSLRVDDGVCTQLICAEVRAPGQVPAGMTAVHIPAQSYICLQHHGTEPEIAASFGRMYDWAEHAGLAVDEFKIDRGYGPAGNGVHELLVRLAG